MRQRRERHPFGVFIPPETEYLLLGSFTGKIEDETYNWYYSNKRNQFWPIMEGVYGLNLRTRKQKQGLFGKLKMALGDIILACERKKNSNLDVNLTKMVFNTRAILGVIKKYKIKIIYFSSRFAEKLFRKQFGGTIRQHPAIKLITLPSPSPRYAAMNRLEKICRYKELLPKID